MNIFQVPLILVGVISAIIFGTITINNSGSAGAAFLISVFFTGGIFFYMFSEDSERKNRLRHGYKESEVSDEKRALFSKLYGREMTKKEVADKITKVVWFKYTSDTEELAKLSLKLFPDLTIKAKYIKQFKIAFWVILFSLIVTNPSMSNFKAYIGVTSSDEEIRRKSNYFIGSVYRYEGEDYLGIASNFFRID